MAGDWIKMRVNLHTHPKVVRMASALQADRLRIVGALHAAWCLFDAHSDDGQLYGYTENSLDDLIGWSGFTREMIAVKWIIDAGDALTMPEYDTHNGQSAKRRAQEADRKRNDRKTSALDADKKRTREEKRRVEKNLSKPTTAAAASAPVDNSSADFDLAFAAYPARCGSNPKRDALQAWNARIAEGVSASEMQAGAERYAAFIVATGKAGSEFVMQAVRFFGKSRHFAEAWTFSPVVALVRPSRSTQAMGSNAQPFDDPFAPPVRPAQGASA